MGLKAQRKVSRHMTHSVWKVVTSHGKRLVPRTALIRVGCVSGPYACFKISGTAFKDEIPMSV